MQTRIILYADKGKVLTNGEIYGTQIFLAEGQDESAWYEITEAKYKALMEQAEEKTSHENVG